MDFVSENPPKIPPKNLQKSLKNRSKIPFIFLSKFYRFGPPKMVQNAPRNLAKTAPKTNPKQHRNNYRIWRPFYKPVLANERETR